MRHLSLRESDTIGTELSIDFQSRLEDYTAKLIGKNYNSQTIKDRQSKLRGWHRAFLHLSGSDGLPEKFSDAIAFLANSSGLTPTRFADTCNVSRKMLGGWCQGKVPKSQSLKQIRSIEVYCGLPENTLTRKLTHYSVLGEDCLQVIESDYVKRLKHLLKSKYLLKTFPPELKEEWDAFVYYKTADSLNFKKLGLKRASTWRVRKDDSCPSAALALGNARSFFGFLCLPSDSEDQLLKGLGFDPDELSIALFGDANLVIDYLQFLKIRSGAHNSGTLTILSALKSLVRPEFGYLRQHPELGQKLRIKIQEEEWAAWCDENYYKFHELIKELKEEIVYTRNPFLQIKTILDREHPLHALKEIAEKLAANAPAEHYSVETKAIHARDVLLIRFGSANPLRAYNFSIMTYRADNSGNLYRKTVNGEKIWCLRFAPEDFKNQKGAASKPYDVEIARSVWPHIEDYLFNHRKYLIGAEECDYVFRPSSRQINSKSRIQNTDRLREQMLSDTMRKVSKKYLKNCAGFGMHALRHITATEYIRHQPEGINVAAAILHDKPETVEKTYAWVRPADRFSHWNKYYESIMSDGPERGSRR